MPRQNYSKIDTLPEKDLKFIQNLAKNRYTPKHIFEHLETRNFKISLAAVKIWHKKYLESIAGEDEKAQIALSSMEKMERDITPDPLIDDEKELEKIAKSYDIPNNIKTLDTNPELVIGASQKMIADLFLSCGVLTKNRLLLFQKGEVKFPVEQVKALKLLFEMYAPLLGVNEFVSPNSAIKSLELYGYDVSKIELLKDVSAED